MFLAFPVGLDHQNRRRALAGPVLGAVLLYRFVGALYYPQLAASMEPIRHLWDAGSHGAAIYRMMLGALTPPPAMHLVLPLVVFALFLLVMEDFLHRLAIPVIFVLGSILTTMAVVSGLVVADTSFHPIHGGVLAILGAGLAVCASVEVRVWYMYIVFYGRLATGSGIGGVPFTFLAIPAIGIVGVMASPTNAMMKAAGKFSIGMGMYSLFFPLAVAGTVMGFNALWGRWRKVLPPADSAGHPSTVAQA